jgi:hypothetical protein
MIVAHTVAFYSEAVGLAALPTKPSFTQAIPSPNCASPRKAGRKLKKAAKGVREGWKEAEQEERQKPKP